MAVTVRFARSRTNLSPVKLLIDGVHREQSRRLKDLHEREMLEFDTTLAELLFRRKQMLSRLGRNGQWSLWLRQQKISRSTADRLVAQYAASHGLADELRHREIAEPLGRERLLRRQPNLQAAEEHAVHPKVANDVPSLPCRPPSASESIWNWTVLCAYRCRRLSNEE